MEWSKLKNIILLLLVSVNAFLLILVGVQESRAARYEEDTRQAAVRVLEQSGITFGPERVPQEAGLSPLTVTRDRESEAIVAQTLLGDVSREGENDVRHRYSSVQGTAEFSMNGTFSVRFQPGAWAKEHERSYEDASQSCLERIDFQGTLISSESGERPGQTVLTYYQNWEGTPLFSCQVTLLWQDDTLLRMEGQRLSGTITSSSEEETLSAATVLVRFLAGVTEGGFVCSRIDEMNAGYLIVSGTTRPVELTPVWRITTDSGSDCQRHHAACRAHTGLAHHHRQRRLLCGRHNGRALPHRRLTNAPSYHLCPTWTHPAYPGWCRPGSIPG